MTNKPKGEEFRTITVCIDAYQDGVPSGYFYHPALPAGESFHGALRLLLSIDRFLDSMDFPKAFQALRSFMPPAESPPLLSGAPPRSGAAATFSLRILFRQNASWQGSLTWMEGRQEQSFRSALELISLIDNALSYSIAS